MAGQLPGEDVFASVVCVSCWSEHLQLHLPAEMKRATESHPGPSGPWGHEQALQTVLTSFPSLSPSLLGPVLGTGAWGLGPKDDLATNPSLWLPGSLGDRCVTSHHHPAEGKPGVRGGSVWLCLW